jgi:catechol-2,3-dioxygenase
MTREIHPATRLGAVHLTVASLVRQIAFYQQAPGLITQRQSLDAGHSGAG